MNFEEYLISKRIDSDAFKKAEESMWLTWKDEFEQIHPNSFTLQKLNLINPVRRKYQLKVVPAPKVVAEKPVATHATNVEPAPSNTSSATTPLPKPAVPRPVFKPKPKI
ncbi:hypothetical protein [Pseudochryseolinea flava]|uniref:Uncharacterized protein n=1 Tax=Pseudochryseolinea flava TaxID=2059302 RepID=A0A364Y102_9BACT|nr:hypothetical protein [Pseudochryseolinea flava]RAV99776.1 hypothetical protein DQQ10_17170 [Pseudochryseolinea flava]